MNRIVVGAHYGLGDWLAQRITALVMAAYTLFMIIALASGAADGFDAWRGLMGLGIVRFVTLLFILSLCYHAWVGVRDIWMDYVKPAAVRMTLHILTALALIGYAAWAIQIIGRL